ncbi:MAG: AtpZ/AtpI family protein [Phycisphaerae bacterium]|nr:AtpZ/AtpI family protein [Phycisphaerae bacterium]
MNPSPPDGPLPPPSNDAPLPDAPGASPDPRLEIPELLRSPVARPASMRTSDASPTSFAETAKAWGIAMDFVFTTIAGLLLGWLADRYLAAGSGAWVLIGLALGLVTAFVRIVRATQRQERLERASRRRD